jgi:hypothetical protein
VPGRSEARSVAASAQDIYTRRDETQDGWLENYFRSFVLFSNKNYLLIDIMKKNTTSRLAWSPGDALKG